MEVVTPTTSVANIPSPTISPPNEAEPLMNLQASQRVSSSGNRSRKSLVFDSPSMNELPNPTDAFKTSEKNTTLGSARSRKSLKQDSLVTQNIPQFDPIVLDEPQLEDEAVSTIIHYCFFFSSKFNKMFSYSIKLKRHRRLIMNHPEKKKRLLRHRDLLSDFRVNQVKAITNPMRSE